MGVACRRSVASTCGGWDSVVLVHELDGRKDVCLVRLHYVAIHHHLVQNEMCLLQVEHNVKLTLLMKELAVRDAGSVRRGVPRRARARARSGDT